MNGDYDLEAAANRLEHLAAERKRNVVSGIQMACFTQAVDWPDAYKIVEGKAVKQLVFAKGTREEGENGGSETLEVVAHVQGIIWRHDLPPFRNKGVTVNRAKFLRQGISLTGLGTPTFDGAIKGILDVYHKMLPYCCNISL